MRKHWRFVVFLVIVDLLFLAGLYLTTGGVRKLTDDIWTVKLIRGCEMDYHTTIGAVALTWPLFRWLSRYFADVT